MVWSLLKVASWFIPISLVAKQDWSYSSKRKIDVPNDTTLKTISFCSSEIICLNLKYSSLDHLVKPNPLDRTDLVFSK